MADSVVGLILKAQNQASPELLKVTQQLSALKSNAITTTASTKMFAGNLGALGGVAMGAFRQLQSVQIALYGLTATFGDAQHNAINLNEALSRSRRLFGEASGALETFASTSANSMGIASGDALKFAATFGNILIGMRVAPKDAATMSQSLVALSADLRVFNQDISQEELLGRIKSALTGNNKSLREFGVVISEAAIRAKALEMGLVKNVKELDTARRAQARYALIMEQTNMVQGAFAEGGNSVTVSQAKMAAKMKEASTQLGVALMPAMRKVQEGMLMLAQIGQGLANLVGGHINVVFGVLGVVIARLTLGIRFNVATQKEFILTTYAAGRAAIVSAASMGTMSFPALIATLSLRTLAAAARSLWAALGPIGWAIVGITAVMELTGAASANYEDNMGQAALATSDFGAAVADTSGTLEEGAVDMAAAAADFFGSVATVAGVNFDMATTNVKNGVRGLIDGFRGNRGDIRSAVDQLKADMKDAMDPKKEIKQLEKEMNSDLLKKALKSNDPIIKAQAEYTQKIMQQRIAILKDPTIMKEAMETGQTIDEVLAARAAIASKNNSEEEKKRKESELATLEKQAFARGEREGKAYRVGYYNGKAGIMSEDAYNVSQDPEQRRAEIAKYGRVLSEEERKKTGAAASAASNASKFAAGLMPSIGIPASVAAGILNFVATTAGNQVTPSAPVSYTGSGSTAITINQTFAPGAVADKTFVADIGNQIIRSLNTQGVRTKTGQNLAPIAR